VVVEDGYDPQDGLVTKLARVSHIPHSGTAWRNLSYVPSEPNWQNEFRVR
jgi:hypothetical protein